MYNHMRNKAPKVAKAANAACDFLGRSPLKRAGTTHYLQMTECYEYMSIIYT